MGITMSQLVASTKRESGHIHTHTRKKTRALYAKHILGKTHNLSKTHAKQNTL